MTSNNPIINLESEDDEKISSSNKLIDTFGSIVSYGSSFIWNNEPIDLRNVADHELLKINNQLSSIFSIQNDNNGNKIDFNFKLPQIVTVGGQSGGKSSTANGLLGIDLFLTGCGMVTKTPIHLQAINNKDLTVTRFEFIDNHDSKIEKTINTGVTPTEEELDQVREEIRLQTVKRAGPKLGISDVPIIIRVSSPKIHDLSIVDLPGLTFEANLQEDQPEDIDVQITNMIKKYIENPRSIILLIVQATNDIGYEPTMKIVKSIDPKGLRTVGVFTKIDLMNKDTDVSKYLQDCCNDGLKFKYGYYAIKNRSPKEYKKYNIIQGLKLEQDYFNNHPVYSKMENKDRLGTINLVHTLKNILVEKIRLTMPDMLETLKVLGQGIPESEQEQITRIAMLISEFCQQYKHKFDNSDIKFNVGSQIKHAFDSYRHEIDIFDPFQDYSDEYIINMMTNCQGDHMESPIPTITILEKCLKDPTKKPILKLLIPAEECLKTAQNIIINIISELCQQEIYSRFPKLINKYSSGDND
jgi:GTP-binding protein EngB required for normal cell division